MLIFFIFLLLLSSKRFVNFLFRVIVWSLDLGFDIEYDLDKLSGEAKNQLVSLQFVDQDSMRKPQSFKQHEWLMRMR